MRRCMIGVGAEQKRLGPDMDAWVKVIKGLGLLVVAPAAIYLLIFQHWRCETDTEQIVATVLGLAGLGAAIKFQ